MHSEQVSRAAPAAPPAGGPGRTGPLHASRLHRSSLRPNPFALGLLLAAVLTPLMGGQAVVLAAGASTSTHTDGPMLPQSLVVHGQWALTVPTAPRIADADVMLTTDWIRPLRIGPISGWGQVHLQTVARFDLGNPGSPDRADDPTLRTDELWLQLTQPRADHGQSWVRWGRQRFQAGPVGLLVANPFDAIPATLLSLALPRWGITLTAVNGRLDTSYVTGLPYVWDCDRYRWLRLERGEVGLTWLVDGLASESGAALDARARWRGHEWVAEAALFRASRTADNYQGWVAAAVASVDLVAQPTFKLNLNVGSVHPGFTPMASNLASAGGNLNFKNGSSGLELNASLLLRPQSLLESETSALWRFGWLDASTLLRWTQVWPGNLQTIAQLTWRPASPILAPNLPPDSRPSWAGEWQLRWQF